MRKRMFGRWANRLAGAGVTLMTAAVALSVLAAAATEFEWR
jgi:hypothetical protein